MKYKHAIAGILFALMSLACERNSNQQDAPNILFAISDDQSWLHTGFAGCTFVHTPAFDRVAREGVYFSNCIAGSPGCAPSRSSIVTGRYHWQNEQSGQHASSWMKKHVPFIDVLQARGYVSGLTGKGVDPFQYARDENDSLWRKGNAAGISHSRITYSEEDDERTAGKISATNYFENFKYFMEEVRKEDEPFFFWYGCHEPHRAYEEGSWKRNGKDLANVEVPPFFPDKDIVRGDMLDYAVEIDWFDLHLLRMLEYLEEIGELDHTIVIVTGDNGMPFPRCKANAYEYGTHVPLAIRYPRDFKGGRRVSDPVSFADLAPTILELTGTESAGMLPISGKSIAHILKSREQGRVDAGKKYVFSGRERHSASRHQNWGYPQRAIRSEDHLLIWNMKFERWPAGAPQRINPENRGELLPMHGIDDRGKLNSHWAYTDIDASPTKSYLVENHTDAQIGPYFELAVARRPEYELYDIREDAFCLNNLAGDPDFKDLEKEMREALVRELKASGDPRLVGPNKEVFDSYLRYSPMREFPPPEKGMQDQ